MLDPALALALRERPSAPVVMRQQWRDLLFLHFACEPQHVQSLLPASLKVDVFPTEDGVEMAWIGFVPFQIALLSFPGGLKVPSARAFLETNVRTYVHREGRDPGVWFFSLDAASRLACFGARRGYSLPYWHADLSMSESSARVIYKGTRRGNRKVAYDMEAEVGTDAVPTQAGSLEFFLVERYLLYSLHRGSLATGRVYHTPYEIAPARLVSCQETLTCAAGIEPGPYTHAHFSSGVDVEVFGLKGSI